MTPDAVIPPFLYKSLPPPGTIAPANHLDFTIQFPLFVATRTLDDENLADTIYTPSAYAQWSITIKSAVPVVNPTDIVVIPQGWVSIRTTRGPTPVTTGPTANTELSSLMTWSQP